MHLIEWQSRFETGIPSVDYEHKELIGLVNQALERLEKSSGSAAASDILGEISVKISAHFALEEKIMRDARYPGFNGHKADHERLLDDIRDIMDAHELASSASRAALAGERLSAWFTEHFRTEDAKFHAFLGGK